MQPVVCFGEVLLRMSAPGKQLLLQSPTLDVHVGGAEANVAVSLSRLGHGSRIVSVLPDSTLGHACLGELRRHGVDVAAVRLGHGRMGMYFLTHGAGQRPAEVLYDRDNSAFAIAPLDFFNWPSLLEGAAWLHVSGITPAVSDVAAEAAWRAVQMARSRSVKISFDCNYRARLWGARAGLAPQLLRRMCAEADLIFGDDRDMALILGGNVEGERPDERARKAADIAFRSFPNLRWMACTQRALGGAETQQLSGILQGNSGSYASRTYALNGIVDRIGAGDAFAAGILHGLLTGSDPQATVEFATAATCLKHSIPGDFNLATRAEVEWLLSEQQADIRR
jgi:2-dehydro-3-deoxygluconokinase